MRCLPAVDSAAKLFYGMLTLGQKCIRYWQDGGPYSTYALTFQTALSKSDDAIAHVILAFASSSASIHDSLLSVCIKYADPANNATSLHQSQTRHRALFRGSPSRYSGAYPMHQSDVYVLCGVQHIAVCEPVLQPFRSTIRGRPQG